MLVVSSRLLKIIIKCHKALWIMVAAILKTIHRSLNMAATSQLIYPMPPSKCSTPTWVPCRSTKRVTKRRGHCRPNPHSLEQWREHPWTHLCKIKRSTMWAETRNRKPVWFLRLKRISKSPSSLSVQTMLTKSEIMVKKPKKLLLMIKCSRPWVNLRPHIKELSQMWGVKISLALKWKSVVAS